MDDEHLPTFVLIEEQEEDHTGLLGGGSVPTTTIDLNSLFSRDLTSSGSFAIRSAIWTTTFGKLMEALPIPALLIDTTCSVIAANEACKKISAEYEQILDAPFWELSPDSQSAKRIEAIVKGVFSTRQPQVHSALLAIERNRLWGRMTFRSIRIGEERLVLVLVEDLTAERALQRSEEMLRDFLNNATDLIQIVDHMGRFLFVNRAWKTTLKYSDEDIRRLTLPDVFHHQSRSHAEEAFRTALSEGGVSTIQAVYVTKDGKPVFLEGGLSCRYVNGTPVQTRGILRDISDRKLAEEQKDQLIDKLRAARDALRFRASHDELTGLWNRSAILETLRRELARSIRQGSPVGIIVADLDHFKKINDTRGHLAGDAVLREVSRRMVTCVRPYDGVGRYGGDEFLIVLPGCNEEETVRMAERIRSSFHDNPLEIAEGAVSIAMSCGTTAVPSTYICDPDAIIRTADDALYRAKEMGGNRVEMG